MYLFPEPPHVGQVATGPNGTAWKWDGVKWVGGAGGPYLSLSGGTLSGPLYLYGPPSAPNEAATKAYVDLVDTNGVNEAPMDGQAYGRELAGWTPVLPITGGVMEGSINAAGWEITGLPAPLTPDEAANKAYVDNIIAGGTKVFIGALPPTSPTVGQLWYDSVGLGLYIWYDDGNSIQWVPATAGAGGGGASGGGATLTVSDTPPSVTNGALWFDSVGTQLYVGYADPTSSQWVAASNSGIADAPNNANTYGRSGGAWTQVLPLTGGTIAGALTVNANITAKTGISTDVQGNLVSGPIPTTPWMTFTNNGTTTSWQFLPDWSGGLDFVDGYGGYPLQFQPNGVGSGTVLCRYGGFQVQGYISVYGHGTSSADLSQGLWLYNNNWGINYYGGAINFVEAGVLVYSLGTTTFSFNRPTAGTRYIQFQTNTSNRWQIGTPAGAEGGSNAGSDFVINSLTDTGAALGTPLAITRATGVVTIGAGATITTGGLAVTAGGVNITAGGMTVAAGTANFVGVAFGSTVAAGVTDLSKHIAVYGTTFGINATGGRLNAVVTAGGNFFVNAGGTDVAQFGTIGVVASSGAAGFTVGASGPTIRSGTGAATGTQPKGSIWMRTDGAVGSTMYVSQGAGTWNAVAGV